MTIFDGQWHSYTESAANRPVLEPHGGFTFTVNPDNGDLTGSVHNSTAITGTVNLASQSIDITKTDPQGRETQFLGSVVFQGDVGGISRTVVCGRFILNGIAESQEEGTWVITKP